MATNSSKIYYANQDNWTDIEFNALHRYLSKMIEHSEDNVGSYDGRIRLFEIKALSLDAMSDETKVLLYCSIQSQNPSLFDECENLRSLQDIKPLSYRLVLNPFKKNGAALYRQYNVLY